MVQVCRSGLADTLQRTDWRIVGWRGSGTRKPSRFVEVVTINRHIKILAWMHVAMGGGLFLVALALLASVYFEGPEYIHTLPFFSGVAFTPDGAIALAACDRYTVPAKLRARDRPELPAWWHRGVRAFRLSDGQELDLVPLYTPIREIFVSRDGTKLMVYGARFGIWDLTKGSLVWDKGNGYEIGIAASADCRLIARGTGYQVDDHSPYINTAVELYDGTIWRVSFLGSAWGASHSNSVHFGKISRSGRRRWLTPNLAVESGSLDPWAPKT